MFEDEIEQVCPRALYEDWSVGKLAILSRELTDSSNPDRNRILVLWKKIEQGLSKICFKNSVLSTYIKNYKKIEQKSVILKGLDFVYGVFNGLNGDRIIGVLLTKLLNQYWTNQGIEGKDLLMLKDE